MARRTGLRNTLRMYEQVLAMNAGFEQVRRALKKLGNRGPFDSAELAHFKSNASGDPLGDFYQNLLASGMEPPMARLTLARKIAAIALKIWKKGERFDPAKLKQQAA